MEVDGEKDPRIYAVEYNKLTISGTSYLDFRDINELVRKYVKGKKTLDYGCGVGRSTGLLKSLGLSVTGVDINENMLKIASEKDVNGRYELITSGNVPAADNTYDLVFSSWVTIKISTKSELKKIGQEICRVLKPDGIFMMIVPSKDRYNNDWLSINTEFEENKNLYSGCRCKTLFKVPNICLFSYYWTEEDYREMLECSDMKVLEIHSPLGKDSDGYNWKTEKLLSPMHVYVAKKK